jgi:hypothetical protein
LLKDEAAEAQNQRRLARIGQLYLDQQSKGDEENLEMGLELVSSSSRPYHDPNTSVYYDGFNSVELGQDAISPAASAFHDTALPAPAPLFRNDAVWGPHNNEAVSYVPNTGLRKNITTRKSNIRPKDRNSIGDTSRPKDQLLAKKTKPRKKDVEYSNEVKGTSRPQSQASADVPSQTSTDVMSRDAREENCLVMVPDFTRKDLPDQFEYPDAHAKLHRCGFPKRALRKRCHKH